MLASMYYNVVSILCASQWEPHSASLRQRLRADMREELNMFIEGFDLWDDRLVGLAEIVGF